MTLMASSEVYTPERTEQESASRSVADNECHAGATFSWRSAPPRKCRLCEREIADSEEAVRLRGELLACPDCKPSAAEYATPPVKLVGARWRGTGSATGTAKPTITTHLLRPGARPRG
jgi:hypothetical protein